MEVRGWFQGRRGKQINKQKQTNKNKYIKKMAKNVSVDAKSTQGIEKDEKEKNINEEKNKEYEAMCDRVHTFKFFENLKKII